MINIRRALYRYRAPFLGVGLLLCFFGYAVYANFFDTLTKEQTIHVLPLSISETGWKNTETLYVQDLSEHALFQSFTTSNSAYLDPGASITSSSSAEDTYIDSGANNLIASSSSNSATSVPSTEEHGATGAVNTEPPPSLSVPSGVEPSTPLSPTSQPPGEAPATSMPGAQDTTAPISGAFKSFITRAENRFTLVLESIDIISPVQDAPTVQSPPTPLEVVPTSGEEISTSTAPISTTGATSTPSIPTSNSEVQPVATTTTTQEIVWNGFSLPALAQSETIENAQIRLSLGAKLSKKGKSSEKTPLLRVQYSFANTPWADAGTVLITDEVSNAINGGFFLFALPPIIDSHALRTLKIRALYEGAKDDIDALYIDSLWIELSAMTLDRASLEARVSPDALTDLEKPKFHDLISPEIDFTSEEDPHFALKYNQQRNIAVQLFRKVFASTTATVEDVTISHNDVGELPIHPDVNQTSDGLWSISLPPEAKKELRPGEYSLAITVNEGGVLFKDIMNFQWGLLAVNTNKTQYQVGDQVTVSLGALSPGGNTLCEATLELYLIDQQNFIRRLPVHSSGLCNGNNVVDKPDYGALFGAMATGTYELYVENINPKDGRALAHTSTTFTVVDSAPFSLSRVGPTRIYPVEPYSMQMTLTASTSIVGTITEKAPLDFTIVDSNADTLAAHETEQELSWKVDLKAGETKTFTYKFDAPDISPYLYELGPATLKYSNHASGAVPLLSVVGEVSSSTATSTVSVVATVHTTPNGTEFTEHKRWQIASDATGSMLIFAATSSAPAGWTCVSCVATSTFFNKFIRGAATYGTASGTATMTHTASGTVNASAAVSSENNVGANVPLSTHSHTLSPTVGSASTLPAYRELQIFQSNSAGEPATIPAGAVMAFDATLPSGWSAISSLNGRYVFGANGNTITGGSNTHAHTIAGTTGTAGGSTVNGRVGGTQATPLPATNSHTHTISSSTPLVNNEPPYIEVMYASTTIATATPTGAITMWTDTPPAGWLSKSQSDGDPFFDKFMRGSATYGTTGGLETHTHADMFSITSSAASANTTGRTGATGASGGHTHQVDVTGFSTDYNVPPYVTAIIARRYGLIPIYTQNKFKWFVNLNAQTPTDPWPAGAVDLNENEPISATSTTVKFNDQIRLRVGIGVQNSTSTADSFKLQYASTTASGVCSALATWTDVGSATSSALWKGYINAGVSDGSTLASTTLTSVQRAESYEDSNPSTATPATIGIGENAEWDFSLLQNGAEAGVDYCFRMAKSDGTILFAYSQYPRLTLNSSPNPATLSVPFDNAKQSTTTPTFEFSAADPESESMTYQVQVDDDPVFGSVNIDANSETNSTLFTNVTTPADKDPFNNGETIRFKSATGLTNGTTYYWKVRARDTGSYQYNAWSSVYSFTVDTSATTTSVWFQTANAQFSTDTLEGLTATSSGQLQLITGSSTGTTTSSRILFSSGSSLGNAWGSLAWNHNVSVGTIKYHIQYEVTDNVWANIPDTDLSGNAAGFSTSPLSLLVLDTTQYPSIRVIGNFTNVGGTPILSDWTVSWGYKINTPTITMLFPNEKTATTTPTFEFTTTDPQNDNLTYEVQWSTSYAFTSSTTRASDTNLGFSDITHATATEPFPSGDTIQFTIRAVDALATNTTYWWRVRAKDPLGSNTYSDYTDQRSFTTDTAVTVSTWFQTTAEQFAIDTLSGATTTAAQAVTVSTSTVESLIAYAEGNVQTPKYRTWNGSAWSAQQSALTVSATINWVVTRAAVNREEYIMGTLGTDQDVNVQVYKNGAWGNFQKITGSVSDATMRGFDIAYESLSGRAMVVSCDGDTKPSYWLWDGTTWTNGGAINLVAANNCGWVRLVSDPTTNKIIVVTRDTSGVRYEAQVWNGTTWGNDTTAGQMQATQLGHEGMAGSYEDSGNQAVIALSNNTGNNFISLIWNGVAWSSSTIALTNDFDWGNLVRDTGTDNMALCYIDSSTNVGYVKWNGSAWGASTNLAVGNSVDGRSVDCSYRVGGAFDGNLELVYTDTTNTRYRSWDGVTLSAQSTLATLQDSWTVQLARTGDGTLQVIEYRDPNDRYDFSSLGNATTTGWTALQTLEADASVGAAPFKEPFMIAARNPSTIATVSGAPQIGFSDGSGPYFKQLSWTDTKPGISTLKYQVEYYVATATSWALVPDALIPGNSVGTGTSPINLSNVLPVASTYNIIRPVANFVCSPGVCPSLNDWTLTWSAGINISGTAKQYDEVTNLASGTVAVARNGVLQVGKTGTISGGLWTIANVNASPGDVLTVFIDGVGDSGEANAVTKYDGVGDVTGVDLFQRHLSIGSDDLATVSNANIGLYSQTNDEDLFYSVSGGTLTLCASGETACPTDGVLIVKALNTYQPGSSANVVTNNFTNNGIFTPNGNTIRVAGSWTNNATATMATSTVIFTATSTTKTINQASSTSGTFYNLTFGETSGTATWNASSSIGVSGVLTVAFGTLARGTQPITVSGNLVTGASGFWTGLGTTTFNGNSAATWSDANATKQDIGRVVVDGGVKTIALGSNVLANSLTIGADDTLDAGTPTSYSLTVLNNWSNNNIFTARSGGVIFAATTTGRTINTGSSGNFYDLTFTGVGGAWSFAQTNLTVSDDFTIATGTVTLAVGTTTVGGSFLNTGGIFAHNNGELMFTSTGAKTITFGATAFTNGPYDLSFNGSGGTWNITDTSATSSNNVRIFAGTPTFPSIQLSIGGSLLTTSGAFAHNNGTVRFYGSSAKNVSANGSSFNTLRFDSTATSTLTDTNVTVLGNLVVNAGTATLPTGTLALGGSLTNLGTLVHSSGTVLFNSTDGGETISLSTSTLYNMTFNAVGGGWTLSSNATATNAFTLTAGTFTLANSKTLAVGGIFTNGIGGASTTFATSTVMLNGGGTYSLNASTTPGDIYGTLAIASSTQISMWNSTSATTTVGANGYLYSQNNAGVNGDLYIYGTYTRTSGTEYWNAARDFDGTLLGVPRRANVRFSAGATALFSSSTLSVVGTSTASTTVAAISGTYTLAVSGGTTTMQYYDFSNLGLTGLTLGTSTKVTSLGDGRFAPGIGAGTGVTVSSSTIDANPALQIYRVDFSTTTAITATNVTQTGGTPASYWWFRNSTGNISGEAFDLDTGDPGSVRWDDSSYVISVSGTVYSDAGITPMGTSTCDGVTTNIRLVINSGSSTYNATCAVGTGAFTIPGVTYIGDPVLTLFLNTNGGAKGTVVTRTPTTNISGVKIYQNRVITRNENIAPLSIANMALYDEHNDSDINFLATTTGSTTLTVRGDTELLIYASTTFTPGGNVTLQSKGTGQSYDATFHVDNSATATAQGTETYTVGGRFQVDASGVFIPASSTVIMTATSTGKTISSPGTINFNTLSFIGSGTWDLAANIAVAGNINLNAGTLTGSGNIDVTYGSFLGAGTVLLTGGTTTIAQTNTLGSTTPWSFYNLILGSGAVAGVTSRGDIATTTVLNKLTINTAHTLSAAGSRWDIRGSSTPFVINGTFIPATSTIRYAGNGATTITSGTYYNLDLNASSSAVTYTPSGIGVSVLGNLTVGGGATTTVNFDTSDPTLSVVGDVVVRPNGVLVGSNSALFSVLGNWNNGGVFTSSAGTVSFLGATSTTISAGVSPFSNLILNGDGAFVFNQSATTTGNYTLTKVGSLTVNTGLRTAVGGQFANNVVGTLTNWNNSTLYLYSGTNYTINLKSNSDRYGTLSLGPNTFIRSWNTNATTTTLDPTAALYSQNHANNNGWLYIFGNYVNTSGTDYWSYDTDFDGTPLAGASRKVDVSFAANATATYTGGGLSIFGTATASTTISNQGAGTYSLTVGGTASTTMRYYELRNMAASGLIFSGTPNVVSISNGDIIVSSAGGSGITVGGTVINQNPAKTFSSNRFATTSAIAAFNVTATGTSVSSWRFTNEVGNISGEAYDNDPAGDPGYIVWTNSASNITVSGRVYQDEGVTVSPVCNGVTNDIKLVVAGVTTYLTSCAAGTGAYSIPGVTFSANDTLTLFIDGTTSKAATVSVSPVSSIADMDLYENRVIVRHENVTPISIAAMAVYDSVSDSDIPFTAVDAANDTLTLPANRKLIVWPGKEFRPNGNITLSGGGAGAAYDGTLELFTNAIFTAQGTETHTIGGSIILGSGATFVSAQSTLALTTSGAARTIDVNQNSLYNLTFNGSGSWTVTDPTLTASNNVTITAGAVTLPTGTTTVAGSFANNGGSFVNSSGTLAFTSTASGKTVKAGGSSMSKIVFNGVGGAWSMTDTNATATASMTVSAGTVTLPSGILTIGTDVTTATSGVITHNSGTLRLTGTSTQSIRTSGSDLSNLIFAGAGSYTLTDGSLALAGNLTISAGSVTFATNTLSIAGSLTATGGTFAHANGTVLFNSTDVGETINPGSSRFYNASFANAGGGWTVTANATTTNNFSLTSAASFTQASSTTLQVGGVFTNSVGGAATTWDGSTLLIATSTGYAINTKSSGSDRYNILSVGSSTFLSMWNSNATTTIVATSGSLYSQDNAAIDGELYIYGNYGRTTGADYWNYAIDFDGTVLVGAARRAVTVKFATNASTTISGNATLNIVGDPTASTTVTNQGAGNYSLGVSAGTINAQYYLFRNLNSAGLLLSGTTTVVTLSNGDYELAVAGGSLISVSSTTVNANASAVYSSVRFATTSAITGTNVSLTGSTSAAWTFTSEYGNLSGESYDNDGIDACGSIRWSNSACLLLQEAHYRWRNDDGGEGAPSAEWYNVSWSKRKRVTVLNSDATSYTNVAVKVPVTYVGSMQTNFADLRFTASDGVTPLNFWRETYNASTDAVVWVKVPTLAASGDTSIFMYYGNSLAADASSGTTTFSAFDDFEDGNITEYSGDTSLFNVGANFKYERINGLDALANENAQTTNGIYRTALTVSQGQTLRYFEYVDTGAGSSDEPCTLFGVQSPGTAHNNYAVCLPLFGVDRVTIAKNVSSNENSGTVLASSTITYATGWHEVRIDWKTNNSIFVSVYRGGSLVATTSATDSTYTTGGVGFSYWFQHGGWDILSARPYMTTDPSVRFGAEQVTGGATWLSALDTFGSNFTASSSARLRFSIENTGLAVTNKQLRLEYAVKGTSPSCESVSAGSYSAVPVVASCGVSPICMYNTGNFTDLSSTTDQLGGAGQFTFGQSVKNSSNKTAALNLGANSFTEVEYAIMPTQNATAGSYCLRTSDNGTSLDGYTRVAEMRLRYNPVITNVVLNNGNDITLTPGATTTVSATATITDLNGYSDIVQATSSIFRSGVGAQCSADNNSCYKVASSSCTLFNCAGLSCDVSCNASIYYFADPTDIGTYAAQDWGAFISAVDTAGGYGTSTTAINKELITLRALNVTQSINYGSLSVLSDTGTYNATTTVQNLGNDRIDISIAGTNLTSGASSIPVTNEKFATSTFTYSTCTNCNALATTTTPLDVNLLKPTTTAATTGNVFWGIAIPFGAAASAHQGQNTFYAIANF